MSKKCSKCGNIVEDAVSYCPQCGNYMADFEDDRTLMFGEKVDSNWKTQNQFEQKNFSDYDSRQNNCQSSDVDNQNQEDSDNQNLVGNEYQNSFAGGNAQNAFGVDESGWMISYKKFWKNYVKFDGRSRRSDFWWVMLTNMIIYGIAMVLVYTPLAMVSSTLYGIYALACLIPMISLYIRRLHDIGKSGLFLLFIFIPVVGAILLIVWCCKDSEPGSNQYGLNPKGMY